MQLNLSDPITHIVETVLGCTIIGQYDSHRSLVVGLGDRAETFLTCSVPDLQLHIFPIYLDRLDLEVDSYKEKNVIIFLINSSGPSF